MHPEGARKSAPVRLLRALRGKLSRTPAGGLPSCLTHYSPHLYDCDAEVSSLLRQKESFSGIQNGSAFPGTLWQQARRDSFAPAPLSSLPLLKLCRFQ
jgi:hypothetical protein